MDSSGQKAAPRVTKKKKKAICAVDEHAPPVSSLRTVHAVSDP